MEVHHHTHPPGRGRKWTHYIWEFLMLFLAVFCGFLAENWREHSIEHARAKELAVSIKKDLVIDTGSLQYIINLRNNRTAVLDKLLDELEKPLDRLNDTLLVMAENELLRRSYFVPETGTYEQMKQAGYLRYFKNELGTSLVRYESMRNLSALQLDIENKFVLENIVSNLNNLSNQYYLRQKEKGEPYSFKEPLIKKDNSQLSLLYGNIRFLQKRNKIYLASLNDLYIIAVGCIKQINGEYGHR